MVVSEAQKGECIDILFVFGSYCCNSMSYVFVLRGELCLLTGGAEKESHTEVRLSLYIFDLCILFIF